MDAKEAAVILLLLLVVFHEELGKLGKVTQWLRRGKQGGDTA